MSYNEGRSIKLDSLVSQNNPTQAIDCSIEQLQNGTCSFNVNKGIGIRQQSPSNDVDIFVQDVVLASTTFIGTILVISLMASGIMMILGGANGNENTASRGKKGVVVSILGLLLVMGSYVIIRVVQYLARG